MNAVNLIFGTTNTLPVGTPTHIFERVYQRSYKPFLRVLYNTPDMPLTLHFSGTMLSWLDATHSEFTDVLGEMVQRRQVELIGGAFYDPVFSLIPSKDRLGQIESLTTFIRQRFGRRPRGAWITEHVWEPSIASTLRNSGIEYIFLDDYNLIAGGVPYGRLSYPCLTEDQGKTVLVFPLSASLLAKVGVEDPAVMIDELGRIAEEQPDSVVSLVFDGSRYGAEEAKGGYDDRWLERFLKLLEDNSDWIHMTTPWRQSRRTIPRQRSYFPSTSYEEMMVWTLEPERQRDLLGLKQCFDSSPERNGFLSGGYFRHFLTRYIESNLLYSKMQYTCVLVNQIRGDKYRKQAARHELWRGQCHRAYWHGPPGGIYQNNLRKAAYSALIEAEKVTREKGIFIPSIVKVDFDMDGLDEFLYQGQEMNAYIHRQSGALFELDYLARPWNYLDTLTRVRERYHDEFEVEPYCDAYWRKAFLDHLMPDTDTIDLFDAGRHTELAPFHSEVYTAGDFDRSGSTLPLSVECEVRDGGRILLEKQYHFDRTRVSVRVRLTNRGPQRLECWYGCEVNLAFASDDVDALRVHVRPETDAASARKNMARRMPPQYEGYDEAEEAGSAAAISEVGPELQAFANAGTIVFEDLRNQLDVSLSIFDPTECWSLPVRTNSLGDGTIVHAYQSSCLLPRWRLELDPDESREVYLDLRINGG